LLFEQGVKANFGLKTQAFATDFLATGVNGGENNRDGLIIPGTVDGKKYTELAGVKVQSFVTCDFQGQGQYVYARNLNNLYNTADNEAGFVAGANLSPSGATEGGSAFFTSSISGVSGQVADLMNISIGSNTSKAPRFCKIRYIFTETDFANALPNLRKWQRHGAEMCTSTDITENAL
jgi:hypothetical protein